MLLHPQHTDLVDVENTLVGPVYSTRLDPLVCWSSQIGTRLERIVADVAQQSPSESPGGVYERGFVVALVLDEEFWYVRLVASRQTGSQEEVAEYEDE